MNTPASNPFKTATLIRVHNPFDVTDQTQQLLPLSDHVRLGALITLDEGFAASINGELLEDDWAQREIIDGDYVVLCPVPAGGGGGKNILRVVALIAVAVAAPYLATSMLGAMGLGTGAMAVGAATAGITIAGSMIVNSLIPIEQSIPQARSLEENSPSYGIDGPKNTAAESIPVPVVYGTFRVAGNIINVHTENVTSDDTQDLNILMALSEGEIAGVNISSIEINDQPINNFNDVTATARLGTANQAVIPWFDDNVVPYPVGVTLSQTWHTYTTQTVVDKIRADVVAPQGFRRINDKGESLAIGRTIEIQYRPLGSTGAWTTAQSGEATVTGTQLVAYIDGTPYPASSLSSKYSISRGKVYETITYNASNSSYSSLNKDGWPSNQPPGYSADSKGGGTNNWVAHSSDNKGGTTYYTQLVVVGYTQIDEVKSYETTLFGKKTSPYRKSFAWNVPAERYEIRMRRTTAESTDGQIIDKMAWTDLNEITVSDVRYKHTALLGLQIRLTDQLNSQPRVTAEVSGRKVRTPQDWYQVSNPWVLRHSSNPAWVALDMLTNTRYGAGYGDHRIDFYTWMRWADYCNRQNLEFNGIFDVNASFWDQLSHVMRCGRAKLVPQGVKYSVAVERADFPAMLFNVSNMKKASLTINWLSMSDRANEIEATYYDENNGYKASVLKVVNPTMQQGATPRIVALNLIGVTNPEQARREAQLLLNMNRFIQQTISFEAPIEALACKVGSMVLVQHDIPQWGFGGRTEAGSTTSTIKLDRPVTMEAGKSYSILLNYDNLLVANGLLTKINGRNFYISSDYIREGVHSLFVAGNEYNVVSIANAGDNVRKILTTSSYCPANTGDAFDLFRLDALEERVVTTVVGDSTELQLTTPMPQAPGRYVKWLFGVLEGSQKQFRVLSIEGEGVNTRTLTCVEYYDAIYGTNDAIAEPPNYSAIPVGEQITNLTAVQIRKNIGTISQPVVRLEWTKTKQYGGADILVKRENDNWQPAGQVRSGESSFEFADLILGETLSFMVLAVDTVGIKATKSGAPIVSIGITSAGDVLAPPTNIRCRYDGFAIRLDFDNPDAAIFLETEIFHATVNNLSLATRIFRGAGEVFVHDQPNIGDNFYWLRSINTDKVPGVYSAPVTPLDITQVENLRLKSAFIGDAAEIIWDNVPSAAGYQVEVRTKSVLRRSERVTKNEYRYSVADAISDGDVDRNIEFKVWAVSADGKPSASLTLAVTNPAPALPTNLSVSPGFKQAFIEFTPPNDPDYVDTLIWIGTTTGFIPSDANRVAAIKGGPINIGNLQDGTNYFIRMTSRDVWGIGVTSAEYNVLTLALSDFNGLSPWAYVTDADRAFIEANLENDAIPSEKIVSITASRITTGTLAVTERIGVEGLIESVAGSMVVAMGPKLIGSKVALFSIMNGTTPLVRFNEDGTNEYRGSIVITGGSGYAALSDKPTSLSQISATDAQTLSQAAQDAQAALDAANGTITTFWQTTAPLANAEGDLWFDTDAGNKLYRWTEGIWAPAQDTAISDALQAASDADAKADGKVKSYFQTATPVASALGDLWYSSTTKELRRWNNSVWTSVALNPTSLSDINTTEANLLSTAAANAAQALSNASTAQETADGKITTFYQTTAPTNGVSKLGDLWFDTDDNKKLYRYNGTIWLATDDARIASAVDAAQSAQTTADGKAETFFSTTTPTGMSTGDLWYNSTTKLLKRYSGSAWVNVGNDFTNTSQLTDGAGLGTKASWAGVTGTGKPADNADVTSQNTAADTANVNGVPAVTITANLQSALNAASTAQETADGKITTFYQTAAPAAGVSKLGDLWFDTDDNKKLYRYSGSAWVPTDDSRIATAIDSAQNAQTTADGKAETFFSTTTPTGMSAGDLWYNNNTKLLKRYSGSGWVDVGNAFNNTNQLTDGAGLGQSAVWASVSGSGKPANGADVTNYADARVANAVSGNNVLTIAAPGGARYSGSGNQTGAIKITLPVSWTNTMMYFSVDVYNYSTDKSFTVQVGGYNYTSGWINVSARLIGSTASENTIRFGHDGSKCCILIGQTNTSWSHVKVSVRNFQAGYSNFAASTWENGWTIGLVTALPTVISSTITDALLDARSIKGQGALATKNSVGYNEVTGTKPPPDATRGADWATTLNGIPARITDNASIGLNLTSTHLGYFDGITWGTHIKDDGSFFFGNLGSGQYLDFDGSVLQLGPKTSIGSNEDRVVTVGAGGDFSSLNEALTALSRTVAAYKSGGFTATIMVLDNHVETEHIEIVGLNLGWITITKESDTPLSVNLSAHTDAWLIVRNGAVGPKLDLSVDVRRYAAFMKSIILVTLNSSIVLGSGTPKYSGYGEGRKFSADNVTLLYVEHNSSVVGSSCYYESITPTSNTSGLIVVDTNSTFTERRGRFTALSPRAFYVNGSRVNLSSSDVRAISSVAVAYALYAVNSNFSFGDNNLHWNEVYLAGCQGAISTPYNYGMSKISIFGGHTTLTLARFASSPPGPQVNVSNGGIVRAPFSGATTNIALNTLTSNGIIFG